MKLVAQCLEATLLMMMTSLLCSQDVDHTGAQMQHVQELPESTQGCLKSTTGRHDAIAAVLSANDPIEGHEKMLNV